MEGDERQEREFRSGKINASKSLIMETQVTAQELKAVLFSGKQSLYTRRPIWTKAKRHKPETTSVYLFFSYFYLTLMTSSRLGKIKFRGIQKSLGHIKTQILYS